MKRVRLMEFLLMGGLLVFVFSSFLNRPLLPSDEIIERKYCTEIGRFDLLFYEKEVSGIYALLPKKSLGAVHGTLDGKVLTGRWIDADGGGDIIITFNEDYTWFTTDYRNDEDPGKWYRDQWHGALRETDETSFEKDGEKYQCE